MKKIIGLSIFILITLSGCGDGDRFVFSGESENWRVEYEAIIYDETSEETFGSIMYKGAEPSPKEINYIIKSESDEKSGKNISLEEGSTTISKGSCRGCAITQEDEEMEVEITWNGKKENLTLKNE
ncbi:hypothetical protein [Planococcus halocryophilus]|uniref:hypothetical protein n=1 Tax=Planococcus halocryophilus TaxID=1215089 RepID=UPI001F0F73E2|nr:hypothetical protein [Planococcus halocryophilus]MCH4827974.1 hypothetical protein [Planococcus halocryophilus]